MKESHHPFIIDYEEEFKHTNEQICIVTQFASGGSLKDVIEKSDSLSKDDAMFYFIMMLLALNYFQKMEIMHRDLKPENILIDILPSGLKIIKIADFGLSKRANSMKG